jgi:hypothetical protein
MELHIRYTDSYVTDMDYTVIKALGYSSATLGCNYKINNLLRAVFTRTEAPNSIIQQIN